jgi:hypothetical protein
MLTRESPVMGSGQNHLELPMSGVCSMLLE